MAEPEEKRARTEMPYPLRAVAADLYRVMGMTTYLSDDKRFELLFNLLNILDTNIRYTTLPKDLPDNGVVELAEALRLACAFIYDSTARKLPENLTRLRAPIFSTIFTFLAPYNSLGAVNAALSSMMVSVVRFELSVSIDAGYGANFEPLIKIIGLMRKTFGDKSLDVICVREHWKHVRTIVESMCGDVDKAFA